MNWLFEAYSNVFNTACVRGNPRFITGPAARLRSRKKIRGAPMANMTHSWAAAPEKNARPQPRRFSPAPLLPSP